MVPSGAVITECAFHGDISYRDSRGIFGGICGYASRSTIINCETTGSVRVRDEKEYPAFKDYGWAVPVWVRLQGK